MLVLAIAVVLALIIPAVTGGSYKRLLDVQWRFGPFLFLGLGIQLFLEYYDLPVKYWHNWGFGLLVASYVFVLAFAARNFVIKGMGIVFIGIACNALVITANQGMPVKIPASWMGDYDNQWVESTVKHHPQQPNDRLRFLSDIIVLDEPFNTVISFGDLILAVGLCDVAFHASRKPKRRGRSREDDSDPEPAPQSQPA